jgi:hypothetical protein
LMPLTMEHFGMGLLLLQPSIPTEPWGMSNFDDL